MFNPVWILAKKISIGALLVLGILGLAYLLYKKFLRVLNRRKSLLAISRATRADELYSRLINYEITPPAHTLQKWLKLMEQMYIMDEKLYGVVRQLESALYGKDNTAGDIKILAYDAALALKNLPLKIIRQ